MQDHTMPHWSWSVPGASRRRRGAARTRRGTRAKNGAAAPAAPAGKPAALPTVFIGAPAARRERAR